MDCKMINLKMKKAYENLTKAKKVGITILLICLLTIVAYDLGCTAGEAIYYLMY